jgi:uncharacterized protein
MNILIAGASGFIGTELVNALKTTNKITVLGRNDEILQKKFSKDVAIITWQNLHQSDATHYDTIINLCGHNIAASRWTRKTKEKLIASRVNSNQELIRWLTHYGAKPHFICANAVGIYGLQKNGELKQFDENSRIDKNPPHDFPSEIGIRWEESLAPALSQGMPVTILRLGVVFKRGQGFLQKLFPSFQCGMGAILGDGQQMISWVHIKDVIGAVLFILSQPHLTGPFNITSPHPVSQKEFAHLLANILHRPLLLRIPSILIVALFGEMGESLLLQGQSVIPKRLIEEGYQFFYPQCIDALKREFQ